MDVNILGALSLTFLVGVVVGMLLRPRTPEYREMDQRKKMQMVLEKK